MQAGCPCLHAGWHVLAGRPACNVDGITVDACAGNICYVFLSILRHLAILHASCLLQEIPCIHDHPTLILDRLKDYLFRLAFGYTLHSRPSNFSLVRLKNYLFRLALASLSFRVRDHFELGKRAFSSWHRGRLQL
jgi:hypothetical protein